MNITKIDGYTDFLNIDIEKKPNNNNLFGDLLTDAINHVNQLHLESDNLKEKLAIGELDNLHDLTIASEKANISLQITMSIRNKIVEAYKEIMRIQI